MEADRERSDTDATNAGRPISRQTMRGGAGTRIDVLRQLCSLRESPIAE
jgi:hypothetical protein